MVDTLATHEIFSAHAVGGQSHVRTARIEFDGAVSWIKRAIGKSFPLAPVVQRLVEGAVPVPDVLKCTYIMDRNAALRFETGRLRALSRAGHPVPHILAQSSDAIILSDTGQSLWDGAKSMSDSASRIALLEKGAVALAKLHVAGEFHGQPYPKNMTYDGERIHFIDTEDDALSVMSLKDAQVRDVWLLAHGCWPFAQRNDDEAPMIARRVTQAYLAAATPEIAAHLKTRLPQVSGVVGQVMHAGISANVPDNVRRFQWTKRGVSSAVNGYTL